MVMLAFQHEAGGGTEKGSALVAKATPRIITLPLPARCPPKPLAVTESSSMGRSKHCIPDGANAGVVMPAFLE
jgi:hypothetical protein